MFDEREYAERFARLRARMAEAGADVFVADHGELIGYLFGNMNSETLYRCGVVPAAGTPRMIVRSIDVVPFRDRIRIGEVHGYPDAEDGREVAAAAIRTLAGAAPRVGFDDRSYGWTAHTDGRFRALLPAASFVALSGISDDLRLVKSEAEVACVERAARAADGTMRAIAAEVRPGMSARDALAVAAAAQVRLGADNGQVGPVLRADGDLGFLHGKPDDEPLRDGDSLHVELIPRCAGYGARLMRPFLVGEDRRGLAETGARIVEIQDRQFAAMRDGVRAGEVDAVLRDGMRDAGLRTTYDNVTGYTLGLYDRTPRSSDFSRCFLPTSDWTLEAGMTFHMYASARGVAFSETVLVTPAGGRRLTRLERRPLRIASG